MMVKAIFVYLLLTISAVAYGQAVVVGDTGHFPVSITNEGTVPLNLYKVVAQKGVDFFIDSGPSLPFVLKPINGKAVFNVLFIPQTPGSKEDKVIFYYDSAGVTFDSVQDILFGYAISLEVNEGISTVKSRQPISILSTSPSPAKEQVTIQYSVRQPVNITLELLDVEGKVILPIVPSTYKNPGVYETTLDVSGLPSGTYITRISGGGFVVSGRVIVSH